MKNRPKLSKLYCSGGPKRGWATEKEALQALYTIWRIAYKRGPGKVPVRAYKCERCTLWHLTSAPLNSNLRSTHVEV